MYWIGHRGGAALRPENTPAAFTDSIARGADAVELDVQLSRDGEIVVYHDFTLNADACRDASGTWLTEPAPRIADLPYAELRSFDIGRARPGSAYAEAHPLLEPCDGARIPLLEEVVALARKSLRPLQLFIDLKLPIAKLPAPTSPENLAERTLSLLRKFDYVDRAVLVGFDWRALIRAKLVEPAARCWFTTLPQSWFGEGEPPAEDEPPSPGELDLLRRWARNGSSPWAAGFDPAKFNGSILNAIRAAGGDGWFPFHRDVSAPVIADAHALDLKVGAWTVNDPKVMHLLIQRGVDAICTDRTDLIARQ